MNGFPAGFLVGILLVASVATMFVGTPDVLEEALGALDAPLVGLEQVLVGHFVAFRGDRAWIGSTVYAPGPLAANQLHHDVAAYRVEGTDMTPRDVREALCARSDACIEPEGAQRLQADLEHATISLRRQLNATLLSTVEFHVKSADEGVLHVSILEVAPRNLAWTLGEEAVKPVREGLLAACEARLPPPGDQPPVPLPVGKSCAEIYVLNSVAAIWDPSRSWNTEAPDGSLGIVGPLAWRANQTLPNGSVQPPARAPAFIPTVAIAWVLGATLVGLAIHYGLEWGRGNAAIPLPPITMLLGVVLLLYLDRHPTMNVHVLMGIAYGLLALAYFFAHAWLDLSGVHFQTFLSTLFILAVGLAALGARLDDVLLGQPLGILTTLYTGQVTTEVARVSATTLFTVGGACVALLLLFAVLSAMARREGLRRMSPWLLQRLLREEGGLWSEMTLLRKEAEAGDLSWGAYASITARVYRAAKVATTKHWWIYEALPGVEPAFEYSGAPVLLTRCKALRNAREGEEDDPLKELWRQHVEAAREARKFGNLSMGGRRTARPPAADA